MTSRETPTVDSDGFLAHFDGVRCSGTGYVALCPAHDDQRHSLSIGRGDDGRWLLKCHAGCAFESVLDAVGLDVRHLHPTGEQQSSTIAAIYDYVDERDVLLYQVVRFDPKRFRQRQPNGRGGWRWTRKGTRSVLYRLSALQGRVDVFITEGEKDADRLWALNLPATTNAGGAGKWLPDYTVQLRAAGVRRVTILPDNDEAGRAHAQTVAQSCNKLGLSARIVPLPGVPEKGDVSDYLSTHSTDDLLALVAQADAVTPEALPAAETVACGKAPVLRRLSDVQPQPVTWLWHQRLARGKYTLLAGDPGTGKTFLALDIAARLTRGASWPDGGTAPQGNVLFFTAEDGLADTVRPRIDALGGDPSRVFVCEAVTDRRQQRALDLARDLDVLQTAIREVRPLLVALDPMTAYIGRTDSYKDAEVRGLLSPVTKLLEDEGVALLGIAHFNKDQQRAALYRPGGSIAFVATARMVLVVGSDPNQGERRVLAALKSNLCATASSLAYRLEDGTLAWDAGTVDVDAESLLARHDQRSERSGHVDAERVLRQLLEDGPMLSHAVLAAMKAQGISERTTWRAKKNLSIQADKFGFGKGAYWTWRMPATAPSASLAVFEKETAETAQPGGNLSKPATFLMAAFDGGPFGSVDVPEGCQHDGEVSDRDEGFR